MKPNRIYFVNDIVKINDGCDETFNKQWKGKICTIKDIQLENDIGATPHSPYYILEDSNGKIDGFWGEEIVPIGLNSFSELVEIK